MMKERMALMVGKSLTEAMVQIEYSDEDLWASVHLTRLKHGDDERRDGLG